MTYIGIDPGTKCGWAVLDDAGERVASGTWKLDGRSGDGAGMRYVRFERLFRELLECYPGAQVAYELVRRHAGTDAAHMYGGIISHVTRLCEAQARPYAGISVGTVKKHATGKGNAGKDSMMAAAHSRWLQSFDAESPHRADDNEADALWIASALREGLQ